MSTSNFYFLVTLLTFASKITLGRKLRPDNNNFIANTEIAKQLQYAVRVDTQHQDDPTSTHCSSPSAQWLRRQIEDVSEDDLSNFFDWQLHILPFLYKLYVAPRQYEQEYFGLNGEYTDEIIQIHHKAQEFWSDSGVNDEIYLLSAHGNDLADINNLVPTLELLFYASYNENYTIYDHASDIQQLISRLPGQYSFPLLTFNAFATDEMKDQDSSIIIGDGYFQFQNELGMDGEGPEFSHTHEFSHHLQFLLGISSGIKSGVTKVAKERELMADAFSAYFLAHDEGAALSAYEITNVHEVAFSVGDCRISHEGHHGTPFQRRCATLWAASLADNKEERNRMGLLELKRRFDGWYETVDGLDDSCHLPSAATPRTYYRTASFRGVMILVGLYNMLL